MILGEFLEEQMAGLAARVGEEAAKVDTTEAGVHDLRVAIRRLSASLKVFAGLFAEGDAKEARRLLRRAMQLAGEVRNRDVAGTLLEKAGEEPRPKLALQRADFAKWLAEVLAEWNAGGAPKLPPLSPQAGELRWVAGEEAAANARRVLPEMARAYFKAGRKVINSEPGPFHLHPFRLKTKEIRYTLEMFQTLYGPALQKRLEELKPLQTALGEVNDCVATAEEFKNGKAFQKFLKARAKEKAETFYTFWSGEFDAAGREEHWVRSLARVRKIGL